MEILKLMVANIHQFDESFLFTPPPLVLFKLDVSLKLLKSPQIQTLSLSLEEFSVKQMIVHSHRGNSGLELLSYLHGQQGRQHLVFYCPIERKSAQKFLLQFLILTGQSLLQEIPQFVPSPSHQRLSQHCGGLHILFVLSHCVRIDFSLLEFLTYYLECSRNGLTHNCQ